MRNRIPLLSYPLRKIRNDRKERNIVPVHSNKKDLKNMLINHRPISLLLVFGKIFDKIRLTSMCECFIENELFNSLSVWFSARWFLHFTTLQYNTWNTKIIWWKSTYRCKRGRILKAFGIKDFTVNSNHMEILVLLLNVSKIT